jgi:ATP-dependent DNA ligase
VAAGGAEARLRRLIPSVPPRLLFVDHVQARGRDFFEVACAPDLEGIVGKLASGRSHADGTSTNWCKIKNLAYTQMTARRELFERRTGSRKQAPLLRVPQASDVRYGATKFRSLP